MQIRHRSLVPALWTTMSEGGGRIDEIPANNYTPNEINSSTIDHPQRTVNEFAESSEQLPIRPSISNSLTGTLFVTKVTSNDVLMGRGAITDNHEGNKRFRELVHQRKAEYNRTSRHQTKQEISSDIIATIRNRGGCFLRKIDTSNEADELGVPIGTQAWAYASDDVIQLKVKQALRDKHSMKESANRASQGADSSGNVTTLLSSGSNVTPAASTTARDADNPKEANSNSNQPHLAAALAFASRNGTSLIGQTLPPLSSFDNRSATSALASSITVPPFTPFPPSTATTTLPLSCRQLEESLLSSRLLGITSSPSDELAKSIVYQDLLRRLVQQQQAVTERSSCNSNRNILEYLQLFDDTAAVRNTAAQNSRMMASDRLLEQMTRLSQLQNQLGESATSGPALTNHRHLSNTSNALELLLASSNNNIDLARLLSSSIQPNALPQPATEITSRLGIFDVFNRHYHQQPSGKTFHLPDRANGTQLMSKIAPTSTLGPRSTSSSTKVSTGKVATEYRNEDDNRKTPPPSSSNQSNTKKRTCSSSSSSSSSSDFAKSVYKAGKRHKNK